MTYIIPIHDCFKKLAADKVLMQQINNQTQADCALIEHIDLADYPKYKTNKWGMAGNFLSKFQSLNLKIKLTRR